MFFVSMIALKPSLGRPATRNGNSTYQGQALFRAMQMWKFTCFVVVAARQKQQEESEEAGNLWNLLVFWAMRFV